VEETTGVELVIHDPEADPQVIGSVPIEGPETVQDGLGNGHASTSTSGCMPQ